jgi:hypothetical protein
MRSAVAALLFLATCASTPPKPGEDPPRAALVQFLDAVQARDMAATYALLTGRWRARLTPERLALDLERGGALAQDRLERARLASANPPTVEGDAATFPIGDGRSVRLLRESGGWKVDALE